MTTIKKPDNVWLGVPAEAVPDDHADPLESVVGGHPVWLHLDSKVEHPSCKLCKAPMRFILQAYAPLSDDVDRVLYVFACDTASCSKDPAGWACFRMQKRLNSTTVSTETQKQPKVDASQVTAAWGTSDGSDWGMGAAFDSWSSSAVAHESRDLEEEIGNLNLGGKGKGTAAGESQQSGKNKKGKKKKKYIPLCYFLDIFEEPEPVEGEEDDDDDDEEDEDGEDLVEELDEEVLQQLRARSGKAVDLQTEMELIRQYDAQMGIDSSSGMTNADWADVFDEFDKHIMPRDEQFSKFMDRINREPDQVVRWQFGGTPLWATFKTPDQDDQKKNAFPSRCSRCGAERIFEMQVLSSVISLLECDAVTGLDFVTAALYTCSESCDIGSSCAEESVWVQTEEEDVLSMLQQAPDSVSNGDGTGSSGVARGAPDAGEDGDQGHADPEGKSASTQ